MSCTNNRIGYNGNTALGSIAVEAFLFPEQEPELPLNVWFPPN